MFLFHQCSNVNFVYILGQTDLTRTQRFILFFSGHLFSFCNFHNGNFRNVEKKISYRRLSTMSSAVGHGEKNVTVWKWYWKKSQTEWATYDATVLLLLLPLICFYFVYILQFVEMNFESSTESRLLHY